MRGKRQKNQGKQLQLAFTGEGWGEAPDVAWERTEPLVAKRSSESPGLGTSNGGGMRTREP